MAHLVYVTVPDEAQALELARHLVEAGLAAGVNVLPGAHSVYRWQGAVRQKDECLLLAQVSEAALADLTRELTARHSYEVPCVVALPIADGHPPFMEWIEHNSLPLAGGHNSK